MTRNEASKLLTSSLSLVESRSIRGWARKQRPEWERIIRRGCGTLAGKPVFECPEGDRPARLAAFIVATAIGL